jgi:transposase
MIKPTSNNKHTMKKALLFAGLDVHAKNITIALAEGGGGEARLYGTIPNDLHALEKVFAKLKKAHPGTELRVCYEAGPTGFVLARRLAQLQIHCTARPPTSLPIPFLLLGGRPVAHSHQERGADQDRPA